LRRSPGNVPGAQGGAGRVFRALISHLEATVLAHDDKQRLAEFFRRALELHAAGAVTADSAADYFLVVVDALDRHTPDAVRSMMAALEDAWQEDA
jgi:hypothetical protein